LPPTKKRRGYESRRKRKITRKTKGEGTRNWNDRFLVAQFQNYDRGGWVSITGKIKHKHKVETLPQHNIITGKYDKRRKRKIIRNKLANP
jgi:hypothetical protein